MNKASDLTATYNTPFTSGYIRDECKFESLEALIERINADIKEGSERLEEFVDYKSDELFR